MITSKTALWTVGIGALLLTLGIVFFMTDTFRFAKTVFLIARVSPYEQVGTTEKSIQVLGDSTGYGTGASKAQYSVAGRLGADWPQYTINNKSVNGRTIGGLLEDTADFSGQYDLILLQIGGNDILQNRNTEAVLTDLKALLDRLAQHTDNIVMMTSGNVGAAVAFSGEKAQQYESLTRALRAGVIDIAASREDFTYVDLFDEPENDPFVENPDTYTAFDELHPSDEGYALWYSKLKPVTDELLSKEQ